MKKNLPNLTSLLAHACMAAILISTTSALAADPTPAAPPAPKWESIAAVDIALTRGNSRDFLGTFSFGQQKKMDFR